MPPKLSLHPSGAYDYFIQSVYYDSDDFIFYALVAKFLATLVGSRGPSRPRFPFWNAAGNTKEINLAATRTKFICTLKSAFQPKV